MCEDRHTTVQQMRDWVAQFVDERDWRPFHSPKNLAMGMAIEAAELMEHFQWISTEESWQVVSEPGRLQPVVEELADVVCYALAMANVLGIDLSRAVREKLEKNAQKYPASEYRGRYGPEDQRPPY
ncbi:MAG: nucleotide pyrophosphohydrolase [Thermoguttaceae bacterium]|nr:nucleotide pyrophosphohydrolase [Thermoguttaceae bacterium]MDW8038256.1 nucleotide pyrophosphohydrolase [Thermoguttaceae bacterium]